MGIVTGKGLLALVRERLGARGATVALGVAAGFELLGGVSRYVSVPLAAIGVALSIDDRSGCSNWCYRRARHAARSRGLE